MAIVLLFSTKDGQDIEVPLFGKFTIGRSSSSDLKIEDKEMSGKHGYFDLNSKGQVLYCDLDSTNGSYLNNNKIHNTLFKVNDVLKVGCTLITIDISKLTNKESILLGKSGNQGIEEKLYELPPATAQSIKTNKLPRSDRSKEKMIDQEESSGNTKMLKLDVLKAKKK